MKATDRQLLRGLHAAERHVNGEIVLFADTVTQSMQALISISDYRRTKQMEYNEKHRITPTKIKVPSRKACTPFCAAVRLPRR